MNTVPTHEWPNDWLHYIDQRLERTANLLKDGHHIAQTGALEETKN